jgi:hypothetical protein
VRRAALSLAVLALSGCGGTHRDALGGGAALLPANTIAFVAARPDAADWRTFARGVLQRAVPAAPKDADEIDIGVLQGGKLVVLTRTHGTWSGAPASRPRPSLADAQNYRQSLRAVPGHAEAQGYLRGDIAARRLNALPGQTLTTAATFGSRYRVVAHPLTIPTVAVLAFRWGAAWLTKDGLGARLHSAGPPLAQSNRVRTIQQLAPSYAPALFDEIPADALAVLDLPLAPGSFELLQRLPRQITELFGSAANAELLPMQLDAVFQGETAVYIRRGGELTLITSPPDLAGAESALRQLGPIRGVVLHRAEIGGQLVLSTSSEGIAAFRGGGAKLSADRRFEHAGFPARLTALAYVTPAGARLLHTRPLTAYASPDGEDPTFTVRFDDPTR